MSVTLLPDGYLSGLDLNWTERYRIRGVPTAAAPSLSVIGRDSVVSDGGAVAMDATKVSNWSGVLNVEPVNGIDLGTNLNMAAVSIRNDAATNRIVRIRLESSAVDPAGGAGNLELPSVKFLDTVRHAQWQQSLAETPYECELVPGETLRLQLAVNREEERYQSNPGQEYGGVIVVDDVSSAEPSYFRTAIPFSVCSDGGVFERTKWPRGLWSASIRLDKVGRMIDESAPDVEYTDEIKIEQYMTYIEVTNADNQVIWEHRTIDKTITNRVPILAAAASGVISGRQADDGAGVASCRWRREIASVATRAFCRSPVDGRDFSDGQPDSSGDGRIWKERELCLESRGGIESESLPPC